MLAIADTSAMNCLTKLEATSFYMPRQLVQAMLARDAARKRHG